MNGTLVVEHEKRSVDWQRTAVAFWRAGTSVCGSMTVGANGQAGKMRSLGFVAHEELIGPYELVAVGTVETVVVELHPVRQRAKERVWLEQLLAVGARRRTVGKR